jgi:hypothetical protein
MRVRLIDSAPGRHSEAREWEAPGPTLCVREIVAERVRREVAYYNQNRPEIYRGLVAPEESERLLNGYRLAQRRPLDPEREVERALRAFETNAFLIFAGARQIDSLDERIDFEATPEIEFIRLVPLVGG